MMNPDEVVYRCDEVEITDQQVTWRDSFIEASDTVLVGTLRCPTVVVAVRTVMQGLAQVGCFSRLEIDCTVDYLSRSYRLGESR